ncbi:MAG: TrkH family potassium uptake protein, partial [Lachnospiraceae bacterium]
MNRSMILFILGWILEIEAALMVMPAICAVIYGERQGIYFLMVIAGAALAGFLIIRKKPSKTVFYLKEGCVITAFSWILLSAVGALPFFLSGAIPSYTDALFETISGFTTTGASILNEIESLPRCILFWRSETHWIGGMGVLVFLMAILPLSGGSHMNLMKAESPGPSVGKLVPKAGSTARILYLIYIGMTVAEIILLLLGGTPLFDALTLSFGTAGTGGFGVMNDSIASYSPYFQWVVTFFMIAFGINFNAYYYMLYRKFKKAFGMEEVRAYLGIILGAIVIIMLTDYNRAESFFTNLRVVAFQVGSIITTTGYSTADFDLWSSTAKMVLVILMFVGACAGSTGGGIKVSRLLIAFKTVKKELHSYMHPKSIRKIQMDDKMIEHDTLRSVNVYLITFFTVFVGSILLVSLDGQDLVTTFTAVAATINNIGPGLAGVG